MKLAVQIFSWIGVVLGVLAILGGLFTTDAYGNTVVDGTALLGGALFFTQGLLALIYVSQNAKS